MVERIVFVDGELKEGDNDFSKNNFFYINAKYGYSRNIEMLKRVIKVAENRGVIIFTNSLLVWNSHLLKDAVSNMYPYCIADEHMCLHHIEDLTSRELRPAHNLEKMYIAGAFPFHTLNEDNKV